MTTPEPTTTIESTTPDAMEQARLDWAVWRASNPANDGTAAESSDEWAARMQERYGDCPDDLPDRQDGQTDAEYRALAEAHMERAAAASAAAEAPADEQTGQPGTDDTAGTGEGESAPVSETGTPTTQPVEQSTAGGSADHEPEPEPGSAREARYRIRLRETEAELTTTQALLAATRQAVIDGALAREGLDADQAASFQAMMEQRGHTADALLSDDGLIDADRLATAITDTSRHFNAHLPNRPRRPDPNPALGRGGDDAPRPNGEQMFTNAFRANPNR